ncbi:MAG: response regulator [Gammaproteobacteria bacterium]|jgi:two-component system response regulator RpfG
MDKATVLIVDDQATSRKILAQIVSLVSADLVIVEKATAIDALAWLDSAMPYLILSDYKMPEIDGLEFLRRVRARPELRYTPFIMITGADQKAVRNRALEEGATEFLNKPIDPSECRARFGNLLELQEQRLLLQDRASLLEDQVRRATQEIRWREEETLLFLARAGEYRDEETGNHVVRMAKYSRLIAEELGLARDLCETIERAAPMHDIGKIGVPDAILRKPGRLSPEEFRIMQRHPEIGYQILNDSSSPFIQMGAVIARGHHEKFDGTGYPNGIAGKKIPLPCRIVAVADVFDALSTKRVYKPAWLLEDSVNFLKAQSGLHFDPECVKAFLRRLEDVKTIQQRYRDSSDVDVKAEAG